jgi:hypothetical protein
MLTLVKPNEARAGLAKVLHGETAEGYGDFDVGRAECGLFVAELLRVNADLFTDAIPSVSRDRVLTIRNQLAAAESLHAYFAPEQYDEVWALFRALLNGVDGGGTGPDEMLIDGVVETLGLIFSRAVLAVSYRADGELEAFAVGEFVAYLLTWCGAEADHVDFACPLSFQRIGHYACESEHPIPR